MISFGKHLMYVLWTELLQIIVKFRINWTLCTGEVRKPRLPGDESVSLFLGFTIEYILSAKYATKTIVRWDKTDKPPYIIKI